MGLQVSASCCGVGAVAQRVACQHVYPLEQVAARTRPSYRATENATRPIHFAVSPLIFRARGEFYNWFAIAYLAKKKKCTLRPKPLLSCLVLWKRYEICPPLRDANTRILNRSTIHIRTSWWGRNSWRRRANTRDAMARPPSTTPPVRWLRPLKAPTLST